MNVTKCPVPMYLQEGLDSMQELVSWGIPTPKPIHKVWKKDKMKFRSMVLLNVSPIFIY